MILHHIHYKMPIYKDCTLGELLAVGAIVFIGELLVFSFLTKCLFGYAAIGVALTFVCFFHSTQWALSCVQKMQYDKPHHYYRHVILKKLAERHLIPTVWLLRTGKWSVRRLS